MAIIHKATATITQNNNARTNRFWASLCLFISAALIAISAQYLPVRFMLLSGDSVREDLLDKKNPSNEDLDGMIASRTSANKWKITASSVDDLANANFEKALRDSKSIKAQKPSDVLKDSIDLQIKSLGLAPVNSYGWALLSYMYYVTEGSSKDAAEAIMKSIETDPYEPSLALFRMDMAATMADKLES